jgi:hypothetical protein
MAEICYIDSNVQVQLCTAHTLPDSHFFVKIRFGMLRQLRILLCRLARQAK